MAKENKINKTNQTNESDQIRDELLSCVGNNIKKLQEDMGWSQEKLASKLNIAGATLSNYINGIRLPSLELLLKLCNLSDVKKQGYNLQVVDFLSNSMHLSSIPEVSENYISTERVRKDFIGNYICYFYDQSKPVHNQDYNTTRELRFGILSIYDEYNCITGETKIKVLAFFHKAKELETVLDAKEKLDEIFAENQSITDRNQAIIDFVTKEGSGKYEGEATFTTQHAFITIHSATFNDSALMIFYSPNKRMDSDYLGGIGSIASVAHGRRHMPSAQKIIISRYELGCSFEEIADHLSLATAPVVQTQEAIALGQICEKLYNKDNEIYKDNELFKLINESDKTAIIEARLNQLVRNYIEKNVCCVGTVSDEEDAKIYSLIKKYAD